MRIEVKRLLPLLLTFITVGCNDCIQHPDLPGPDADRFLMSYSISNDGATRQISYPVIETNVGETYLLFFSGNDFVAFTKGSPDAESPATLNFCLPEVLQENTQYSVLALANTDGFTPSAHAGFESYLESLAEGGNPLRFDDERLQLFFDRPMTPQELTSLPMLAKLSAGNPFSFKRVSGSVKATGSLVFSRQVARIDIVNEVADGFELLGVGLCNWRDGYSPLSATYSGAIRDVLSDENPTCNFVEFPKAGSTSEKALGPAFYCFPSYSEMSIQGDQSTTSLILKARYRNDEAESFYRVNIGGVGSSSVLKANSRHTLSIRLVERAGKSSAKEAYLSTETSPVETFPLTIDSVAGSLGHLVSIENPSPGVNGKIVIDGFAPECFNSFIDIPLKVVSTESEKEGGTDSQITVSSELKWPLEGMVTKEPFKHKYYYCPESYTQKMVAQKGAGDASELISMTPDTLSLTSGETFYLSVGAMAPDDPKITRTLTVATDKGSTTYDIEIRPRDAIINDVILENVTDNKLTSYLITDRNFQQKSSYGQPLDPNATCWNEDGSKKQAYHYHTFPEMKIPFKVSDTETDESKANEMYHFEMNGVANKYSERSSYTSTTNRKIWWNINNNTNSNCESPFYSESEDNTLSNWGYANTALYRLIGERMKVSKMRMFLMSDIPAKSDDSMIPICCYFPCFYEETDATTGSKSYAGVYLCNVSLSVKDGAAMSYLEIIRCTNFAVTVTQVTKFGSEWDNKFRVRPAREFISKTTNRVDAITTYMNDYLGYKKALRLHFCTPDVR